MSFIRRVFSVGVICLAFSQVAWADGLTPREEFFENQVRPLLVDKCQECHDTSLQESDLRLDSRAFVLQGGISGPAAIARNIDDSAIIKAIKGQDGFERMPPDAKLSDDQIAILEKWVRIGLPWTSSSEPMAASLGDQVAIGKAAKSHWAFQPVVHPDPPVPANDLQDWIANPIDAFIAEGLADHDLRPNSRTSRRVLIRRLFYDLIGLPPSPQQMDALEQDARPDDVVLDELTTTLLASEHHGERWARYWLDLARYADTRDWMAQAELRYPYAYTYRDYVITSLNADKPYDQFIREQIAADAYAASDSAPELAALGLLTVGPQFRNDKLEQIADKIDVVCRGLMGITVGCARCHDHKYDPVPIEDFYSLYGVFASSTMPETFPTIPGGDSSADLQRDFRKQLAAKKAELEQYKQELKQVAEAALLRDIGTYMAGFALMSIDKRADIRGCINKLKVDETAMTPLNNSLAKTLNDPKLRDDPLLGPWQQGLSIPETQFRSRRDELLATWKSNDKINPRIADLLETNPPTSRTDLVSVYAEAFAGVIESLGDGMQTVTPLFDANDEAIRKLLFGSDGWLRLDAEQVLAASRLTGKGRKELGDRQKAITEVEATHPAAPPKAMTLVDLDKPITPFVMLRGEPARRGDRVPRQFLKLIAGDDRKPFIEGSGRRELAEAIVAPSNPLTARVAVNRVWSRYFGHGLAESLDDFGLRSDSPSHPELLDWLAVEFVRSGWSMKWLHRTIVSSNTYRQSAEARDDGLLADPANRLLWRQNRRRLDFEAMRDSMLAVADGLDTTIGGRSVRLSELPYSRRRSVYAYIDRIELDPMLRTFDFASPTASASSRSQTTIPQQALFGMNHPFVAELCRTIATDVDTNSPVELRVGEVYRRVYGRLPTREELTVASRFIDASEDDVGLPPTTWQYGYGPREGILANDKNALEFPFFPLNHWTGSIYQASEQFPDPVLKHVRLASSGGHPGTGDDQSVIRRWTAPEGGAVRVAGTLKHSREGSDGIEATVRSLHSAPSFSAMQSSVETAVDRIEVRRGDVIDFIVSSGPTTRSDSFLWTVVIEGIDGELEDQTWESNTDFQAPPPPPLSSIAQLAQALMLTNEFQYLD